MDDTNNPYAARTEVTKLTEADCLLVDGNVAMGKDRGVGKLLFTRTAMYGLRVHNQGYTTGIVVGGLLGAMIGSWIDKRRAEKRSPPAHMEDEEVQGLDKSLRKKVAGLPW
ncbi:MAG: hypothetical protein R3C10_24260 [Pirellulales bacterium]